MPIVYRLGDILCLPSKGPGETWGLAINEAMASGRPVIVTDKVGCAQDLLRDRENGFVVNHNQQAELENLMISLSLPTLRAMGQKAQKNIQYWSFDSIAKGIEETLNK